MAPSTCVARKPQHPTQASNSSSASSNLKRNHSKIDQSLAKRNASSPPSLTDSPQSLSDENNSTSSTLSTPYLTTASEFEPMVVSVSDSRSTCASASFTKQPKASDFQHQSNDIDGVGDAGAAIVKRLKRSKTGSMRDAAAFYLSSFLEHIDTLGKLPPNLSDFFPRTLGPRLTSFV